MIWYYKIKDNTVYVTVYMRQNHAICGEFSFREAYFREVKHQLAGTIPMIDLTVSQTEKSLAALDEIPNKYPMDKLALRWPPPSND